MHAAFEARADAVLSSLNRVRSGLTQSRGKGKGKKKFSEREEMVISSRWRMLKRNGHGLIISFV